MRREGGGQIRQGGGQWQYQNFKCHTFSESHAQTDLNDDDDNNECEEEEVN